VYVLSPLVCLDPSWVPEWNLRALQVCTYTHSWLLEVRESQGKHQGPAFSLPDGEVDSMRSLEQEILERLAMIQEARPELISKEVQVYEEYGVNRSFRRGATSEARARGVSR
jgi:hypothetical protein